MLIFAGLPSGLISILHDAANTNLNATERREKSDARCGNSP